MASKVETNSDPGDDAPWTPFGLGYLAIMEFLFEEDPDAGPPPADGYPSAAETVPLHSLPEGPTDVASLITHRPRRSLEELRQLVLATGVHLFLRDGLRLKADSLTYAAVFAHIRQTRGIVIHRSTVHQKIWCNQDEFRAEVLAAATRYGTDEPATATRQAMAAQTVTRNPDGSVNVRQLILDNSLATVVAQLQVSATSPTFRRWQSIKAALLSEPTEQQAEALRRAVDRSYDELHAALEEIYRSVVPLVGLRVNPALGISEYHAYYLFLVICVTFSVGADYNTSAGSGLAERTFPVPRVDGTGRSDDWPVPAIASLAVLDLLFVPQDQTQ
jgi:hypothetical protein